MAKYYVEVDDAMTTLHREDGPALERTNGDRYWYKDGKLHRDGGPAVEYANGDKFWYNNGNHHREDGPAVELTTGYQAWYVNGIRHRVEGPARIWSSNNVEYWLDGEMLTKDQWEAKTQRAEELTVAEIEKLLGKRIKVIK